MTHNFILHAPSINDGSEISKLIKACPPLDTNSNYCNLLQCHHFSATSVVARSRIGNDVVGFVSGYSLPSQTNTLFIWQVAVHETARGKGLAKRMIQDIIERNSDTTYTWLETTITDDNKASWALFQNLAKKMNGVLERTIMFDKETHFDNKHDTEYLVKIGPLSLK
jgi:L-2,4-diaminobutyric acid acetyltransferase